MVTLYIFTLHNHYKVVLSFWLTHSGKCLKLKDILLFNLES